MMEAEPWHVVVGGCIGLLGAFMAYIFALFHSANMKFFASLNLLENRYAVYRALLGGFFVVLIGLLVPHTMFWGEDEFQVVANMLPASELSNICPTTGLTGWEMESLCHWNGKTCGDFLHRCRWFAWWLYLPSHVLWSSFWQGLQPFI
jgi:hypothetical protein